MIKQDEISKPDSCLNKASDDEPIFVLRANDPVAAMVVRYWASAYISHKLEDAVMLTEREEAKAREARDCAGLMERWRREKQGEARRKADVPTGTSKHKEWCGVCGGFHYGVCGQL